jgi:membrane protein
MFTTLRRAAEQFIADDCMTLAASLAYYTLFAMPPLLFLLVTVVSLGMSAALEQEAADQRAQTVLEQQAAQLIGNAAAAEEIGRIIENAKDQQGNWWQSLLSLAGVLVAATGLVAALQAALNRVWCVKPNSEQFAVQFMMKRLLSLAMIIGFGFLLLVSFIVATILHALTHYATDWLGLVGNWPTIINQLVSFATSWIFFAAVFRFMPDAKVTWVDAAIGSFFTVILFTLGRWGLFLYLQHANPGAALGSAAGSLVVILLWVYYSSIILLFGAEITANLTDGPAEPVDGAVHVEETVVDPQS